MTDAIDALLPVVAELAPERLNQSCLCITLDRDELALQLDREAGEPGFFKTLTEYRPHLFSNVPVFLSASALAEMREIVEAIEATAQLLGYRQAVLAWAPEISQKDHGPAGALMGYDFHLDDDGPKLIEVNTNAGGAFLNAVLAGAQVACCGEVAIRHKDRLIGSFGERIAAMFLEEWRLQRGPGSPATIAIVDDVPQEQYLYPEFVLARQMLAKHGMDAVIGDAGTLQYLGNELFLDGRRIDLVYNRLCRFHAGSARARCPACPPISTVQWWLRPIPTITPFWPTNAT